jgi:hypothetical protein
VPDNDWKTVCESAHELRWTRCTSATLFVLVETPTILAQANQLCRRLAIPLPTRWPTSTAFSASFTSANNRLADDDPHLNPVEPIESLSARLASIRSCDELQTVLKLTNQFVRDKQLHTPILQMWTDEMYSPSRMPSSPPSSSKLRRSIRPEVTRPTIQTSPTISPTDSSRVTTSPAIETSESNESNHNRPRYDYSDYTRWSKFGASKLKKSTSFWPTFYRKIEPPYRSWRSNAAHLKGTFTPSPPFISSKNTLNSAPDTRSSAGFRSIISGPRSPVMSSNSFKTEPLNKSSIYFNFVRPPLLPSLPPPRSMSLGSNWKFTRYVRSTTPDRIRANRLQSIDNRVKVKHNKTIGLLEVHWPFESIDWRDYRSVRSDRFEHAKPELGKRWLSEEMCSQQITSELPVRSAPEEPNRCAKCLLYLIQIIFLYLKFQFHQIKNRQW